MIIFRNVSQAKNYIKRNNKDNYFNEGCGCCYFNTYTMYDEKSKRVVEHYERSSHGNLEHTVTVLGRVKSIKSV